MIKPMVTICKKIIANCHELFIKFLIYIFFEIKYLRYDERAIPIAEEAEIVF